MLEEGSGISPEVIRARGYFSATEPEQLRDLGFADFQLNVPALVMPLYNAAGLVTSYHLRPDDPREKDGKPLKYETPHKSKLLVDVPPAVVEYLADPSRPLLITEGAKKADAAVSRGLDCVSLMGTWSWRGTNGLGGKAALPDWDLIALNGREVLICFDSDVSYKPSVATALHRLRGLLRTRDAKVRIVLFVDDREAKVGLDDFFVAGNSVEDLLALAQDFRSDLLWPRPDPLPAQVALPKFPAHVLPRVLRDFVCGVAESTQTPIGMAAALGLSVLSTVSGGHVSVKVDQWIEPANLFLAVSSAPATRKSAAMRIVYEVVDEIEAELIEAAKPEIADAKASLAAAEIELKRVQGLVKSGKATEAELRTAIARVDEIEVPAVPRLYLDDATSEAVEINLAQQGGSLTLRSAEGGRGLRDRCGSILRIEQLRGALEGPRRRQPPR
jgi:hypothetical protein